MLHELWSRFRWRDVVVVVGCTSCAVGAWPALLGDPPVLDLSGTCRRSQCMMHVLRCDDHTTRELEVGPSLRAAGNRRQQQLRQQSAQAGACWLFFGCRQASEDFLYQDEFKGFESDGTLTRLTCAFSRAQQDKVYVQHLLQKQARCTPLGCDLTCWVVGPLRLLGSTLPAQTCMIRHE